MEVFFGGFGRILEDFWRILEDFRRMLEDFRGFWRILEDFWRIFEDFGGFRSIFEDLDVFLMYSDTVFGCIFNAFCCISAWDWILGTIFCRYMYVVPALFGCLGTGLGNIFCCYLRSSRSLWVSWDWILVVGSKPWS